ncbi:MAG: hypothetical protein LQ340_000677 [Diploschistes diacapsis]|nr:MAG: hypothetical protein LQ340_000677 [Diploschistes diacapsis]
MPEPVDEKARSEDYDSSHKFSADSRTPIPEVITSLDRSEEKKLLWKLDMHVLPTISILYMLAFIDRINIGNAKIQGLDTDLNMTGNQYNVALFIFFIPYILCEVPSNLLLKRIKPSTWLSFIMLCWGLITVFQGVTQSYAGLVACRFFLGLFEAGFVPGKMLEVR